MPPIIIKFLKNIENEINNNTISLSEGNDIILNSQNKQISTRNHKQIKNMKQFNQTLKYLQNNHNIIIKPTVKNLGLTIIDQNWYNNDCYSQLNDKKYYKHIENQSPLDIVQITAKKYMHIIKKYMHEQLPQSIIKYLTNRKEVSPVLSTIPEFYILPKLHKPIIKGRPIVASHNWISTPMSKFIDAILQFSIIDQIANKTPMILKNSTELIKYLEYTTVTENTILVTMDVESLYTNINQDTAIDQITNIFKNFKHTLLNNYHKHTNNNNNNNNNHNDNNNDNDNENSLDYLDESNPLTPIIYTIDDNLINDFLSFILKNNYIKFNDTIVIQTHGIAMGTPTAPSIANIFMWNIEKRLVKKIKSEKNYSFPKHYYRYLDDIIFLWEYSQEQLTDFINLYNSMEPNIKVEAKISTKSIEFLDTIIHINEDKQITFNIHQKELNKYLYVPFTSNHPIHTFKGLIKTELIRYCRNCTNLKDFIKIKNKFFTRLRQRGYPIKLLKQTFITIQHHHRFKYLNYNPILNLNNKFNNDTKNKIVVPFSIHYSPIIEQINIPKIINKHWTNTINSINKNDTELYAMINNLKPLTAYKQTQNLIQKFKKKNDNQSKNNNDQSN